MSPRSRSHKGQGAKLFPGGLQYDALLRFKTGHCQNKLGHYRVQLTIAVAFLI
jgi:hypothetical protein